MLYALLLVLIGSAVNAFINIQIKFAKDKREAMGIYKKYLFRLFQVLMWSLNVGLLVIFTINPKPVTRFEISEMIVLASLWSLNLSISFVNKVTDRLYQGLVSQQAAMQKHVELSGANTLITKSLCDTVNGLTDKKSETITEITEPEAKVVVAQND